EDWVVRYKNRLLQLARQNRHWAPAQSRVRVRENEPGHIVIHYRGQSLPFVSRNSLGFFYGEEQGKGRCPFPCNPVPETYGCGRQASSLSCRQSSLETRLAEYENSCLLSRMVTRGTFLLWTNRGHS